MAFFTARPRTVAFQPRQASAMKARGTGLAALLSLPPPPSAAHPHVFADAAATFVVDAENRLTAVRVAPCHNTLLSPFIIKELGVDPSAPL